MEALRRRNIYELVQRPRGRKVIKNRWVFDVKTDGWKKARLVAKGFSQVEGLDYNQVFSPVVRFETVHLISAMAALGNWTISGLDVRNAYLYGELDEEIYMEQPEGFCVTTNPEHHVIRLKKALYGLKQAGLMWWQTLRDSIKELGFEGLISNGGLFVWRNKHGFVIAVIYVDDTVIALVSLSIHNSCSTLSFIFLSLLFLLFLLSTLLSYFSSCIITTFLPLYFSSYDSHQATGRQDCYCTLE